MAIFVVDSSLEGFQSFCEKLASMVDLNHVSSFKDCLGEVSKGDIIVSAMDGNADFDKGVGQFRKFNMELKVIGFYQDLSEEQIIEHSESKAAADIYLTENIDEGELAQSLKELGVTPQFFSEETKTLALGIVKDHLLDKSLTQNAKEISQGLDQVFSSALPSEFKKIKKENKKNQESESLEELSIGSEVSMSDEIDLDISDDEIELSGNEEELVQEVNPNEVALDDEASAIDLEFASNEDASNTEFTPDEIDFGGDEEEAIVPEDDSHVQESIEAQSDDGADIDLIEELSFGAEESSEQAVETSDELESNTDSTPEDDEIKLFNDDSPSQVLNLGEATGLNDLDLKQTETESVLDEIEFGVEDGSSADSSKAVDNDLEVFNEDSSLPDFNLSEVDISDEDFDLVEESETNTIQGVKMTSSDELLVNSGDDDSDDPLDDIKTKMMEIDKLLLSDGDQDEEPEIEDISIDQDISMAADDQTLNQNINLLKESIAQEENVAELERAAVEVAATHTPAFISSEIKEFQRSHEDELIRLGETISSLRNDRESLMDRVQTLEDTHDSEKKDFLSLKAELDEKKIEIAIIKKRYSKQIEDLNLKLDLVENKKDVLVEQNRKFQNQFEKLRVDKKTDISKVRYREQELEQKLELLRNDAEVQIQNRDHKILELKRRIDTLEFDIENSQIKERKSVDDQGQLEDKMHKVIKTLRSAIGDLEGDSPINIRERLIKKNLDV